MQPLYLLIGCFGYKEGNFVHCASVENLILKLVVDNDKYQQIMDLCEKFGLFDRPILNLNSIKKFLFELHNLSDIISHTVSEINFLKYQKFISMHHLCCIYIKLSLQPSLEFELDKKILISKSE